MAQDSTKSKVSTRQKKVICMMSDPSFTGTVTEMLNECDVPRRTYYNWLSKPEFVQELNDQIDKYAESELPRAWRSLMKACDSGNVNALKLYFELRGKYKQDIPVNNTTYIVTGRNEMEKELKIRERG